MIDSNGITCDTHVAFNVVRMLNAGGNQVAFAAFPVDAICKHVYAGGMGVIHILRHHRGGRGVTSLLMTTDDKGRGGVVGHDDVIKKES